MRRATKLLRDSVPVASRPLKFCVPFLSAFVARNLGPVSARPTLAQSRHGFVKQVMWRVEEVVGGPSNRPVSGTHEERFFDCASQRGYAGAVALEVAMLLLDRNGFG